MQDISQKDTVLLSPKPESGPMTSLKNYLAGQKSLWLVYVSLFYVLVLLVHTLQRGLWPQEDGWLAFAAVIAPYFFLPILLLLPFCFLRRRGLVRISLLLALVVFGLCFPPHFSATGQAPAGTRQIKALTWNVLADNKRGGSVRQVLDISTPDVVALQEADWQNLDVADDILRQYPYHLYLPEDHLPPGEAILSKFPILEYGVHTGPATTWDIARVLWVRLDIGQGKSLMVVNAHPISAINTTHGCFYCPHLRDKQIHDINLFVTGLIHRGEKVLLLGDMNITDREKSYSDLTQGLRDMQLVVGGGPGHSWGLRQLNRFWAFVRIDYMLLGPAITPLSLSTDCAATGSDHCALIGIIAL